MSKFLYAVKAEAVLDEIVRVMENWKYTIKWDKSLQPGSDSRYIRVLQYGFTEGGWQMRELLTIRVSSHQISRCPRANRPKVDSDVYAILYRDSAYNYVEFLHRFARRFGREVPKDILLLARPDKLQEYTRRMKRNREEYQLKKRSLVYAWSCQPFMRVV